MDYRLIKDGDLFLLTDQAGNISKNEGEQYGLYARDTRFLSRYDLLIDNIKPFVLSSGETEDRTNKIYFTKTDFNRTGSRKVLMKREQLIFSGTVYDKIWIKNYFSPSLDLKLTLKVDADYLDIFQVRNYLKVKRSGTILDPYKVKNGIRLGYLGKDGVRRETIVKILNEEGEIYKDRVELSFTLKYRQEKEFTIGIIPRIEDQKPIKQNIISFERAKKKLRSNYQTWEEDSLIIKTDQQNLNQLIDRSLSDLKLLSADLGEGLIPIAGIPWYAVPFGRDSIITSLQTLMVNKKIAQGTLKTLARLQGKEMNGFREEEPGKIMHEIRFGELANLNLIPHTPYYGTIDSTPLFLILAAEYFHWTGDLIFIRKILPNLLAALEWIDRYGDIDQDGYVEYGAKNTNWAINQGWKDSTDSSVHQDGNLAVPPIALVEVQGYIYQAKKGMAEILFYLGEIDKAKQLEKDALGLKERFNRDFWMEDKKYFAFGLDYQKKQIASITSNPGHGLYSGIINQDKAKAVVKKLLSEEMFNGWGIRTMGKKEMGYNPASYHNGSVWPHDNSIIIQGLIRYNYPKEAAKVINSLLKASQYFKSHRLPELFCGFDHKEMKGPVEYPVACSPQAWASGSIYLIIQSLLGLNPEMANNKIYLKPIFPDEINKVEIKNLKIGDNRVDFTLTREGSRLKLSKTKVEGNIKLIL